ncbi:HAMP domain-containing sensor histidine kinase [Streptomyces sp. SID2888]|uniref:sensor histidine kinase n=1 Tax=Streptomyces sp. SID2888 TaxID=2690256 RepID=UPI00136E7037|nr:HAMP domain-containing sensor histidine kinase [Streptomyces sp. SID2888]MYV46091.1 GHKL domain-containing protein [Streptomyces sp. SID2888]
MLDRLPVGLRTALLAGLVALLAAGSGAWWLRQHLYADQMVAEQAKAVVQARAVARALVVGNKITWIRGQLEWPYVVVAPRGLTTAAGGLEYLSLPTTEFPPAPSNAPANWSKIRTVHIGSPLAEESPRDVIWRSDGAVRLQPDPSTSPKAGGPSAVPSPQPVPRQAQRLANRSLSAVALLIDIPPGEETLFYRGGRFTVYVLIVPDQADAAVAAVDPALAVGVPLASLLVGATAYASTRRALRPVEAIRVELAEIAAAGAERLRHRVPVPRARDQISRLAITTNQTLDRLEQADRVQRRFVADAAHELRSPVTALRARLEIALTHPDHTDWPENTRNALDAARRLQDLTDDLLFLSRPDSPAQRGSLVDLAGTVQELVHLQPADARITVDAPPSVPVRGNALHLHRLLRNLLDNAVRHARTHVTVTIVAAEDDIHLTVHNDGSGIPPADRERIFDRFTRLDEARTRDAGGSGLGLAIARDIARQHHGTLTVADTPPGAGAAFLLCLPAPRPADP